MLELLGVVGSIAQLRRGGPIGPVGTQVDQHRAFRVQRRQLRGHRFVCDIQDPLDQVDRRLAALTRNRVLRRSEVGPGNRVNLIPSGRIPVDVSPVAMMALEVILRELWGAPAVGAAGAVIPVADAVAAVAGAAAPEVVLQGQSTSRITAPV
jgi:hypothetical protein